MLRRGPSAGRFRAQIPNQSPACFRFGGDTGARCRRRRRGTATATDTRRYASLNIVMAVSLWHVQKHPERRSRKTEQKDGGVFLQAKQILVLVYLRPSECARRSGETQGCLQVIGSMELLEALNGLSLIFFFASLLSHTLPHRVWIESVQVRSSRWCVVWRLIC